MCGGGGETSGEVQVLAAGSRVLGAGGGGQGAGGGASRWWEKKEIVF